MPPIYQLAPDSDFPSWWPAHMDVDADPDALCAAPPYATAESLLHDLHEQNPVSLELYTGEFTISPIPLSLEWNYCSHKCSGCFANLNSPNRRFDAAPILRMLAEYTEQKDDGSWRRTSAEAHLLRGGYPVLISNKSDAFAHSNYQQALPILELLAANGIPMTFQTRGGKGISEALAFLPPSVWYVSFACLDDAQRKITEPGAPSIPERLELLTQLREAGHRVVVGMNPLVPEWLPRRAVERLLVELVEREVEGAWIDAMHLSADQEKAMSDRDKRRMGLPLLERVQGRRVNQLDADHVAWAKDAATAVGLSVYGVGHVDATDYWRPYFETYARLYPTTIELVNTLREMTALGTLTDGEIIGYDTFAKSFGDLPDLRGYDTYVRAWAAGGRLLPALLNDGRLTSGMTADAVLRLIWSEHRLSPNPTRLSCFAYASEVIGGARVMVPDASGMPYLMWSPNGCDTWMRDVTTGLEVWPE